MNNRIIAKGLTLSNDMYKTKLNNNDMVIGASGSGKSTGYVIPNIMQGNESMIIADTKSILYRQLQKRLEQAGFEVHVLDFVNLEHSCKYNPLDYIPFNKKTGRYGEKEIMTIANAMIPTRIQDDTLWEDSARLVLECLISFVLETLPGHEKNMASVTGLYKVLAGSVGYRLFEELEAENPDSFAVRRYKSFQSIFFRNELGAALHSLFRTLWICMIFRMHGQCLTEQAVSGFVIWAEEKQHCLSMSVIRTEPLTG